MRKSKLERVIRRATGKPRIAGRSATIMAILAITLSACASIQGPDWSSEYQDLSPDILQESAQKIVDCLTDAGFPGYTATWDGGVVSPEITPEQGELHREARTKCANQVGGPLASHPPLDVDQLTKLYNLEVQAYQCLTGLGYSLDSPPSLQKYLDGQGTAEVWGAWKQMTSQLAGEADFRKASHECPDPLWFAGDL